MKTLKYRSIFTGLTAVAMSVFLFTACEKDTDSPSDSASQGDRLEKFSRLTFSGTSSSTNSGSGTFIGGSSNVSFVSPGGGSLNFVEASASSSSFAHVSSGSVFTDPRSTGPAFGISGTLGLGGGTFTANGETYELDFGYCASQPIGGNTSLPDTTGNVKIFVGIEGAWQDSNAEQDLTFIYIISYDDATEIASFEEYNGDGFVGGAFIVVVRFEDDGGQVEQSTYFGTEGSISFSGSNVDVTGAKLQKVVNNDLDPMEEVDFSADIECVEFNGSND